jgi:hypothetical protein
MIEGPSKYGGPAVLIVVGVGLLIAGKTLTGLVMLGVGILALAVMCAPTLAAKAFFLAVGASACSGVFAYRAASWEITGRATYSPHRGKIVTVTRADSPAEFRKVTNLRWAGSGLCLVAPGIWFIYARKADDCL